MKSLLNKGFIKIDGGEITLKDEKNFILYVQMEQGVGEEDSVELDQNDIEIIKILIKLFEKNNNQMDSIDRITKEYNLDSKNKQFIRGLAGKSPEEGLEIIVNRVLKNKEGNWVNDVNLVVKIGQTTPLEYKTDDPRLEDMDGLIIKFNQISRGVVKARGGEIR